jgi:hypothetical protein
MIGDFLFYFFIFICGGTCGMVVMAIVMAGDEDNMP